MKAFVAVFAGVAAASAAPEADPYLLAHPVYLDPHATSGETVELPTGEVVPDTTNAVKLATADHLLAKALHTPWLWHYGKREAEADPWLLAHPVLLDPHASSGETVELPNGAVVPDETNSVKLAKADHLLAKALHTPLWWHYGKREAEADAEAEADPLVVHWDGAVTPDYTPAQKLAAAAHFAAKGWPLVGYGGYLYGKRSADAEAKPYYALGYGGLGYGYGYYGKRSAEAEAKPYYALGYGGLGYGYGYYGKRSAEAEAKPYYGVYGYGVAPYAVVPEIEPKATGFIVSPASGAVTPDFTAEQKEANPEIADGSKSIDVPVVTGFTHYLGKREAEPYYYGGLGYGYGGYLYGKRSAEAEAKPYYTLGYGGLGYGYGYYGKRSAEAEAKPYYGVYGYGVAPYAVVPEIEPKATGFIVSPASGAVTPDFTAEQKEANPEIAEGSKSIDVPVVTGFTHYLGKREAEPYYYGGLGYGYGGYLYGKRSAEAEAKPYYGLYGYGLYGYGGLCAYCG